MLLLLGSLEAFCGHVSKFVTKEQQNQVVSQKMMRLYLWASSEEGVEALVVKKKR